MEIGLFVRGIETGEAGRFQAVAALDGPLKNESILGVSGNELVSAPFSGLDTVWEWCQATVEAAFPDQYPRLEWIQDWSSRVWRARLAFLAEEHFEGHFERVGNPGWESRFQIRSIADPRNRSESAWYSESRGELSDVRMIRDKNLLHMEIQSGLGGSWATRIEIFDRNSSSSDVECVAVFQAADTLGELIDWCETFIIEQGHAFGVELPDDERFTGLWWRKEHEVSEFRDADNELECYRSYWVAELES